MQGFAQQRIREKLNRGVVAMPLGSGRVYLSWRLMDDDPKDVAFNVYRTAAGKTARLNAIPVAATTDFVDPSAPAGELGYFVRPVLNGAEGASSEIAAADAATARTCLSFKLAGNHTFQKVGIADLDGDGRLDFVIKQPNTNVDPYERYWKKSPGTYQIEAYRHDGKFLWRHDMGWSIEQGIWYSPYLVYDLDGDGSAEVAIKTGEGDPRDADGRVTSGPEYLSILDGRTGKEKAKLAWPDREGYPSYNYYCRNQLGLAFLDAKTPCLLVQRGTYNTIKLVAYDYNGREVRRLWQWTDSQESDQAAYRGQGAHCLRAADIDGDGRDEVILGSACIDDNGTGLWSTKLGHPDHVTIGDLDPARPGLEIHYGLERKMNRNGICMADARTGKLLWALDEPTSHVHGQGLCADIDPEHPGCECYGGERDFAEKRWLFNTQGKLLAKKDIGGLAPRAAYWDADPQRELIRKTPQKLGGEPCGPRIEGSIIAIADILGDWREEIITSVAGELRIYVTTTPATNRRPCLLRDPIYRLDVATASQAYYQIPALRVLPQ